MFGFKHTLNNFDHNEVTLQKSRLFGRLIQVNGVNNLPKLFPYLDKRVHESIGEMLKLGKQTSSMLRSIGFGVDNANLTWHRGHCPSGGADC